MKVRGGFDVQMTPADGPLAAEGIALARFALDKRYHGALTGTGVGSMLTSSTDTSGAAAYVALERVAGTLQGRAGSFVLAHLGTMTKERQELSIQVVPGSGTGALAGLTGTMHIVIENKAHVYEFEYELPG